MKLVTGKSEAWRAMAMLRSQRPRFSTGLAVWDGSAEGAEGAEGEGGARGGLVWGAVHELLHGGGGGPPWFVAAVLARAAVRQCTDAGKQVVWVDGAGSGGGGGCVFAPAVIAAGVPAERLVVLRARTVSERLWGIAECLRCEAVAVVVAEVGTLSRLWARRLQLAAERGGGVGLLTREVRKAGVYAAATRWRVWPVPVEEAAGEVVQRWGVARVQGGVGVAEGWAFVLEVWRGSGDGGTLCDVRAVSVVAGGAARAQGAEGRRFGYA